MLGLVLAAFVVVIPFWEPSNTGLATKDYNTAFWDGESTVSFVYQQYGALAHSLLNGRLDLEADPPAELLALDNPYDAGARDAAQINDIHWDHAFYNGRYYVYFGIVPCDLPRRLLRRRRAGRAPVVPAGVRRSVPAGRGRRSAGQSVLLSVAAPLHL